MAGRRKFLYNQGSFFVLYGDYKHKGLTFSLGPDRTTFLAAFIVLLTYILIKIDFMHWNHLEGFLVNFNITLSILTLLCFFYTATCNAGVLVVNEDNSIENQDVLEKQGWSYCAICKLYRPPKAKHCKECGVCFKGHDHHCSMMGQCVAKNNLISFWMTVICFAVMMGIDDMYILYTMKLYHTIISFVKRLFGIA